MDIFKNYKDMISMLAIMSCVFGVLSGVFLILTSIIISVQILFGYLGHIVIKKMDIW